MAEILNGLSLCFIPAVLTLVIGYGIYRKAPVYDYFISGVKDGLKTAVELLPFIIAIFVGIESLVCSGAMGFLEDLAEPVFRFFAIPKELTSLVILRPVSGSGSMGILEHILATYGPDSHIGRSASVMMGSCETVFYVLAVYFGVTSVKHMRHCLPVGLISYIIGILASVFICRYI